eukprot:766201-Hanusia_phi.AAC.3
MAGKGLAAGMADGGKTSIRQRARGVEEGRRKSNEYQLHAGGASDGDRGSSREPEGASSLVCIHITHGKDFPEEGSVEMACCALIYECQEDVDVDDLLSMEFESECLKVGNDRLKTFKTTQSPSIEMFSVLKHVDGAIDLTDPERFEIKQCAEDRIMQQNLVVVITIIDHAGANQGTNQTARVILPIKAGVEYEGWYTLFTDEQLPALGFCEHPMQIYLKCYYSPIKSPALEQQLDYQEAEKTVSKFISLVERPESVSPLLMANQPNPDPSARTLVFDQDPVRAAKPSQVSGMSSSESCGSQQGEYVFNLSVVEAQFLPDLGGRPEIICNISLINAGRSMDFSSYSTLRHEFADEAPHSVETANLKRISKEIMRIPQAQCRTSISHNMHHARWNDRFELYEAHDSLLDLSGKAMVPLSGQPLLLIITITQNEATETHGYYGKIVLPVRVGARTDRWFNLMDANGIAQLGINGMHSKIHLNLEYSSTDSKRSSGTSNSEEEMDRWNSMVVRMSSPMTSSLTDAVAVESRLVGKDGQNIVTKNQGFVAITLSALGNLDCLMLERDVQLFWRISILHPLTCLQFCDSLMVEHQSAEKTNKLSFDGRPGRIIAQIETHKQRLGKPWNENFELKTVNHQSVIVKRKNGVMEVVYSDEKVKFDQPLIVFLTLHSHTWGGENMVAFAVREIVPGGVIDDQLLLKQCDGALIKQEESKICTVALHCDYVSYFPESHQARTPSGGFKNAESIFYQNDKRSQETFALNQLLEKERRKNERLELQCAEMETRMTKLEARLSQEKQRCKNLESELQITKNIVKESTDFAAAAQNQMKSSRAICRFAVESMKNQISQPGQKFAHHKEADVGRSEILMKSHLQILDTFSDTLDILTAFSSTRDLAIRESINNSGILIEDGKQVLSKISRSVSRRRSNLSVDGSQEISGSRDEKPSPPVFTSRNDMSTSLVPNADLSTSLSEDESDESNVRSETTLTRRAPPKPVKSYLLHVLEQIQTEMNLVRTLMNQRDRVCSKLIKEFVGIKTNELLTQKTDKRTMAEVLWKISDCKSDFDYQTIDDDTVLRELDETILDHILRSRDLYSRLTAGKDWQVMKHEPGKKSETARTTTKDENPKKRAPVQQGTELHSVTSPHLRPDNKTPARKSPLPSSSRKSPVPSPRVQQKTASPGAQRATNSSVPPLPGSRHKEITGMGSASSKNSPSYLYA